MKKIKNKIGAKLTKLRLENNLTQEDLRIYLGYSSMSGYSHLENGVAIPTLEKCIKLSELYSIPIEEIIGE